MDGTPLCTVCRIKVALSHLPHVPFGSFQLKGTVRARAPRPRFRYLSAGALPNRGLSLHLYGIRRHMSGRAAFRTDERTERQAPPKPFRPKTVCQRMRTRAGTRIRNVARTPVTGWRPGDVFRLFGRVGKCRDFLN